MDSRTILSAAAVSLALATAGGALGAHGLKAVLAPQSLEIFETAVRYHFYHSLGLLGAGIVARTRPTRWIARTAWLLVAGIVLFSGSLYALTFGAPRILGVVTPLGGTALILSWLSFAITVRSND